MLGLPLEKQIHEGISLGRKSGGLGHFGAKSKINY